jgi:hypothetical protein
LGIGDWGLEVEDWRGKIEARQARVEQAEAEHRKPTGRQGGKPSRGGKSACAQGAQVNYSTTVLFGQEATARYGVF